MERKGDQTASHPFGEGSGGDGRSTWKSEEGTGGGKAAKGTKREEWGGVREKRQRGGGG